MGDQSSDDGTRPRGGTTARLDETVKRLGEIEEQLCEEDRALLRAHSAAIAEHTSALRVLKVLGSVAMVIVGIVGGLALKAIYGSGVDAGTIQTRFEYLDREFERNDRRIAENNDAIRALERELSSLKKSSP